MVYDPRFCKPEDEMDEISRKIRRELGEKPVDYARLFQAEARSAQQRVKPEDEMDVTATSIRLQSERDMSVDDAEKAARRMQHVYLPGDF